MRGWAPEINVCILTVTDNGYRRVRGRRPDGCHRMKTVPAVSAAKKNPTRSDTLPVVYRRNPDNKLKAAPFAPTTTGEKQSKTRFERQKRGLFSVQDGKLLIFSRIMHLYILTDVFGNLFCYIPMSALAADAMATIDDNT